MWRRRTVTRADLDALAALVVIDRPAAPTTRDILDGFNIARLDTLEQTPASMVLDRMGVRTASELLDLLRLVSIDSALCVIDWAALEAAGDVDSVIDAIRVTLRGHELST
jgi:hypothetical protein